jgi:GNAT superfamily N-acetyltransferase
VAEVALHLRGEVRPGSLDMEMDDAHPLELRRASDERIEQHRRRGRSAVDVDLIARLDACDGPGSADDLHDNESRAIGWAGWPLAACRSALGGAEAQIHAGSMVTQAPFIAGVRIRPIRTDDRVELSAFYAGLSPESRYARFHAVSRGIGDAAVGLLCGPDHEHREGFVAVPVDLDRGGPRIIGHLCLDPAGPSIEMAVAVADEWQGHGIGKALLGAAVEWARNHGIDRLQASALSTNSAVLGLIASVGRPVLESSPSAGVVVATIDVGGDQPKAA